MFLGVFGVGAVVEWIIVVASVGRFVWEVGSWSSASDAGGKLKSGDAKRSLAKKSDAPGGSGVASVRGFSVLMGRAVFSGNSACERYLNKLEKKLSTGAATSANALNRIFCQWRKPSANNSESVRHLKWRSCSVRLATSQLMDKSSLPVLGLVLVCLAAWLPAWPARRGEFAGLGRVGFGAA